MKSSITVWGRRSSFNVQKVLWTLDELGLHYEHRNAGGSFGGLDDPAFLAMNPNGLVPVILDEEGSVWESNSIVRYLCAKHSQGNLWIEDSFARSKADRWIDWAATALQPSFTRLFWGYYRTPEAQRDKLANQAALSSCLKHFRLLDAQLCELDLEKRACPEKSCLSSHHGCRAFVFRIFPAYLVLQLYLLGKREYRHY